MNVQLSSAVVDTIVKMVGEPTAKSAHESYEAVRQSKRKWRAARLWAERPGGKYI